MKQSSCKAFVIG